jgi:5'-3' exonuclease
VPGDLTLLVDTSSLVYRALFSIPDSIRTHDGTQINAAYGFIGMLAQLVRDHNPDFLACATDEAWRPSWRVELLPGYKSQRAEEGSAQQEAEERLEPQMPAIAELLGLCGVALVGWPDYEAEDVIGTLAARAGGRVAIVSGDRDLFQLVRDPDVRVLYPKRGVSNLEVVDESYIATRFGIPARTYRDYALLRGDPSDGLPGVKGIGEKSASALLTKYGNIDAVIDAARSSSGSMVLGKIAHQLDYVDRARKVITIPIDLPIPEVDLTRPRVRPDERVWEVAERYRLAGPVRRLVAALTMHESESEDP